MYFKTCPKTEQATTYSKSGIAQILGLLIDPESAFSHVPN